MSENPVFSFFSRFSKKEDLYSLQENRSGSTDWYTLIPAKTQQDFELFLAENDIDAIAVKSFISAHLEEAKVAISELKNYADRLAAIKHVLEIKIPRQWVTVVPMIALVLLTACGNEQATASQPVTTPPTELPRLNEQESSSIVSWEITPNEMIAILESSGKLTKVVEVVQNGTVAKKEYLIDLVKEDASKYTDNPEQYRVVNFVIDGELVGQAYLNLIDSEKSDKDWYIGMIFPFDEAVIKFELPNPNKKAAQLLSISIPKQ